MLQVEDEEVSHQVLLCWGLCNSSSFGLIGKTAFFPGEFDFRCWGCSYIQEIYRHVFAYYYQGCLHKCSEALISKSPNQIFEWWRDVNNTAYQNQTHVYNCLIFSTSWRNLVFVRKQTQQAIFKQILFVTKYMYRFPLLFAGGYVPDKSQTWIPKTALFGLIKANLS